MGCMSCLVAVASLLWRGGMRSACVICPPLVMVMAMAVIDVSASQVRVVFVFLFAYWLCCSCTPHKHKTKKAEQLNKHVEGQQKKNNIFAHRLVCI